MDPDGQDTLVVFTNAPDRSVAMQLARVLVEQRLAACVNVFGGCTSVYRWDGAVETAEELPVIIKTRASRYAEVEAAIRKLHPYELPEIVAVPVVHGLPEYLDWVSEETAIPIG
jgi:periplasmic divalent cation tolerance protein